MIIIIRLIYYKKIISCDYPKLKLNIEFKINIITLKRIKINFYNISKNLLHMYEIFQIFENFFEAYTIVI